jgi:hypothetical protein
VETESKTPRMRLVSGAVDIATVPVAFTKHIWLRRLSYCLQIEIRVDQQCKFLCRIPALSSTQAEAFGSKLEDEYRVNM